MKIVHHRDVEQEDFPGGAAYRTLVGDDQGSTPLRAGIQVSPPGYATPHHWHPYLEIVTVLDGVGEAWSGDGRETRRLEPGMTLVIPAGHRHGFRNTGARPLKTYGIHASPDRIVEVAGE